MIRIYLRKIKPVDKKYFSVWWRDKELLKLTSGVLRRISDREIEKYFKLMMDNRKDRHFMITADKKAIGHISLSTRKNNWHETQIVMGDKKYWGKGYGTKAIKLLIKKAKKFGISKIYLEVRPDNIRAIKAYKKSGFVKSRTKKYFDNKYLLETLVMRLFLSNKIPKN